MNKIFTFHDIYDANRFEKIISIIESKYSIISIKEIESFYYKGAILNNSCLITFDDGNKSFYDIAYPILKRHKIPASIFVSPQICRDGKNFWFQEISNYNVFELKKIISDQFGIKYSVLLHYSIFSILKCFKIEQRNLFGKSDG